MKLEKQKKNIILFINIIIILFIILICFGYVKFFQAKRENDVKYTFTNMVSAMRKTAGGYLVSHQQSCDDWAVYINSHDMTIEETLDFLKGANSIEGVMAHVIEYDTMTGYSTVPDNNGNCIIDYSEHREDFADVLSSLSNQESGIFITHAYINPIDNTEVIGFCRNINLTENHSCMLIRTVTLSDITENWVFPSDFSDAELSLINSSGDFIICSSSMDGSNFWDYISQYNKITDEEIENIYETISGEESILKEYVNKDGNHSYFVFTSSVKHGNWYYAGYVPEDSLNTDNVDFILVIIVSIGFLLLIIVDTTYFASVNRQLRENAEEVYKANQAKTRFLSSMSHDIRTPMNAIIGMTSLSMNHIDDPNYIHESLKKITLAGNHLLTLVNDILDISKFESGKLSLNPTVFSIAEAITNLVNIVRPQIKEKEHSFNIYIRKIEHEYLLADELRLNQIFINLLTNAVKYTKNKGTISIELIESPSDTEKNIILTYIVSDNGIGMTKEFQQTMYETFSRASDSRIDKIQGSGLGLAITKQMVELMGGNITCDSEIGKGTTFRVDIELAIADKSIDEFVLPPMNVLIVDDDTTFLETASDIFKALGVSVDMADSGRKAVDMLMENDNYSVIIVDWKMPDMNGIETIKQIRAKIQKKIPVIISSAYDYTEVEEQAISAGADGFLNKPFFRSSVYSKFLEILDLSDVPELANENSYENFAGLHLLIAEDNDINWEIISEIMDNFDITSVRAENGKIAVDMIKSDDSFDAILMDIQMPVMNGREATALIRSSDDERLKKIPIIAMTADAFAEDIQLCLECGMNGHVAKPIEIKKIFDEFRKAGISKK